MAEEPRAPDPVDPSLAVYTWEIDIGGCTYDVPVETRDQVVAILTPYLRIVPWFPSTEPEPPG